MGLNVLTAALFLFSILSSSLSFPNCPGVELIQECTCELVGKYDVQITCKGLTNPSQVKSALMASEACVKLTIEDSFLPSLPISLGPHQLKQLNIINTKLPYVSPPIEPMNSAFDGLVNLEKIKLEGISDLTEWDWSKLEGLSNLKVLDVSSGSLTFISKQFSTIGGSNLEEIYLNDCELKNIADGGLAFPNLKTVQIVDTPLKELRPSMFHKENKIETFIIYDVKIDYLPTDTFTSMKNLKYLSTDESVFSLLNEHHLENMTLERFSLFRGAKTLDCDCRYSWILKHHIEYLGMCVDDEHNQVEFKPFLEAC